MTVLLLVLVAVLGLAVGSFLNVVVWRLPRGESLASPPSACPRCGHAIRPRDNVPVLSWLLLGGRCRDCRTPISVRYPLVEAATAVLFVLAGLRFGLEPPGLWAVPAFLYLAAVSVALALIDIDTHTLPNRIVLPSYVVGGVLLAVASAGTGDWAALLRGGLGLVVLWVAYFAMVMAYPRGMGFGDVKLAGVLGLYLGWVGWGALAVGAFAAFALGGVFALGLLLTRRAGRKSGIPFGPWMLLGAGVGVAWGERLWALYLGAVL
ncbi:A24 family peptidase [Cellulomonas fimi]|uniref:Prepilin leader peptidase/N-methyltransferase n=1 Tax=Cellulomonas fimi TaxID=1708 RepID=A0A7Y0QHH0_CELFI|nr:A24 family peptidase [Cellulomonas fimi]NMR20163.1 prepilin peptidase [Cellulomonas fimi]